MDSFEHKPEWCYVGSEVYYRGNRWVIHGVVESNLAYDYWRITINRKGTSEVVDLADLRPWTLNDNSAFPKRFRT